jgi:hypothetical protein
MVSPAVRARRRTPASPLGCTCVGVTSMITAVATVISGSRPERTTLSQSRVPSTSPGGVVVMHARVEHQAHRQTVSSPLLDLDLGQWRDPDDHLATGYRPDLSWLELPVLNPRGRLIHDGGVTRFPGLYLMGMPFPRRRKSTLIDGAAADARDLTAHLATHLDSLVRVDGLAAAT